MARAICSRPKFAGAPSAEIVRFAITGLPEDSAHSLVLRYARMIYFYFATRSSICSAVSGGTPSSPSTTAATLSANNGFASNRRARALALFFLKWGGAYSRQIWPQAEDPLRLEAHELPVTLAALEMGF